MSVENVVQSDHQPPAARIRLVDAAGQDRTFWICLACAVVLHASLFLGMIHAPMRVMGEPEGSLEGVSVDLVDPADLAGAADAARPQQPVVEAPARPEPVPEQKPEVPAIEDQTLDFSSVLEAERKSGKAAEPANKQKSTRPLDLSLPLPRPDASRSNRAAPAGAVRPPGITRSGENDAFGRAVIHALRQTMPSPSDLAGRVTVRILLSQKGDLVEINVVRSSGDPLLDQNVVFAVRQTNFPLPPLGSTAGDRTFLVTYIFR